MRPVFLLALAYVLLWRAAELALSARNARRVLARGGRRVQGDGMGAIAGVHALWILLLVAEELLGGEPVGTPTLHLTAAGLYVLTELLRLACILCLGERWNVNVVVLDQPPVRRGPYRWLRHPNYVAVVLGLVALPLALGRPWALAAVPLKLLALRRRLAVEERALAGSRG